MWKALLAYFADDAIAIWWAFPTGIEVYAGTEQIRGLWQDSVTNHFRWEVEITTDQGSEVYVDAQTWHDFTIEPESPAGVYGRLRGQRRQDHHLCLMAHSRVACPVSAGLRGSHAPR
jgi:hypothetical protein